MRKINLSAIVLISSFLLMPHEGYGSDGPNQFFYSWIDSDDPDGPQFEYRDISSTGNLVAGLKDDNHVGPLPIGFSFPFYRDEYDEFYIQSNGMINFNNEYINHSNRSIPAQNAQDGYEWYKRGASPGNFIAWMWDNMYAHDGSFSWYDATSVYYETVGNDLIIQFVNYGTCCSTTSIGKAPSLMGLDAQVILSANGQIRFQYLQFTAGLLRDRAGRSKGWTLATDATVGIEDVFSSDGLEVAQGCASWSVSLGGECNISI